MEESYKESPSVCRFNIRVYGIVINSKNEILLCREHFNGHSFVKFPGGGLEYGEGTHDCLHREFKEELDLAIEINEHIYTTDFFQQSAFFPTDQVIAIYYKVTLKNEIVDPYFTSNDLKIDFFWKSLTQLTEHDLSLPIDQVMVKKLLF